MKKTEKEFKKAIKSIATNIAESRRKVIDLPTVMVALGKKTCDCISPFCEHANIQEFSKDACPYPK